MARWQRIGEAFDAGAATRTDGSGIGRVADAVESGFQGVRTRWNRGFMAFGRVRCTRMVVLMVLGVTQE
jgi:hypothetical protein